MTTLLEQISPGGIPSSVAVARPNVLKAAEHCYDVLIDQGDEVLSAAERAGLGLITAWRTGDARLANWFGDVLRDHGIDPRGVPQVIEGLPRLARHIQLASTLVDDASKVDAALLRDSGPARTAVVVGQVIGYVSYLSRLLDGLAELTRIDQS